MPSTSAHGRPGPVPVRTILVSIGLILLTGLALLLLSKMQQVLVWIVIALFFAVALYPVVNWVEHRLARGHRILATLLVFLLLVIVMVGVLTLFVVPVTREGTAFAQQLPHIVDDARAGRGPIGQLLIRTNALTWIQQNHSRIASLATGLTTPAAGRLKGVASGVAGVITVFVLTLLMVLEGPKVVSGGLNLIGDSDVRERVRRVSADCAKSITGYISGNLFISVVCGALTFAVLKVMGVPFSGLIALFVAVADLIPLVGATLGAIVALIAAGVHSLPALIVVAIFFVACSR